jgi:hypothetical protein
MATGTLYRTQNNPTVLTGPFTSLPKAMGINEGVSYLCTDTYQCFHLAISNGPPFDLSGLPAGVHYWHGCANTATTPIT